MSNALYSIGATVTDDFKEIQHLVNLAIHRISEVILTEKSFAFQIPESAPGTFGLPWHEPRLFRIRFSPGKAADYVRERIWADQQQITDAEDGVILLEITTRSEPELMAWVRSFGDQAKIEDSDAMGG